MTTAHDHLDGWTRENPERLRLVDWLYELGEFAPVDGQPHPGVPQEGRIAEFRTSVARSALNYWGLTPRQEQAARSYMQQALGAMLKADAPASMEGLTRHVGTPGGRILLQVVVLRIRPYTSRQGYQGLLNIWETMEGDAVVYSGQKSWDEGSYLELWATVTAHRMYQGEAQTYVSRPKIVMEAPAM